MMEGDPEKVKEVQAFLVEAGKAMQADFELQRAIQRIESKLDRLISLLTRARSSPGSGSGSKSGGP